MNGHQQSDPLLRLLADLRPMAPSASRDNRVIASCHAALDRQRPSPQVAEPRGVRATLVDLAMAAAIAAYGLMAAIEALRIALVQ